LLLICLCLVLSNIHPFSLQVDPSLLYLRLQFFIRIRYIVEREYAPAEFEEEVCAEGDEYPEGDLKHVSHTWVINLFWYGRGTYDRHDLLLNLLRERHNFHEYREVQLYTSVYGRMSRGTERCTEVRSIAMLIVC
tara:strand:+ start:2975 stop:3379 length:405 start_codon:yes stop_codon:yes gene_type:complete